MIKITLNGDPFDFEQSTAALVRQVVGELVREEKQSCVVEIELAESQRMLRFQMTLLKDKGASRPAPPRMTPKKGTAL